MFLWIFSYPNRKLKVYIQAQIYTQACIYNLLLFYQITFGKIASLPQFWLNICPLLGELVELIEIGWFPAQTLRLSTV